MRLTLTLSSLQGSTFLNAALILLFPFRRSKKWSENHDSNSVIRTKLSVLRIVTSLLSVYFAVRVIMCQIRDEDRTGDCGHCHCTQPCACCSAFLSMQQKRRGMLLSCILNWFCVCKFRDLVKTTKVLHFSLFISLLPVFQSRPDNLFLQKNKQTCKVLTCMCRLPWHQPKCQSIHVNPKSRTNMKKIQKISRPQNMSVKTLPTRLKLFITPCSF